MTSVGDMLEGFVDNMSDKQLDEEIKLFQAIARGLKISRNNYAELGVIIDKDYLISNEVLDQLESVVGYKPYREKNKQSGFIFLYFETEDHAKAAASWLEKNINDE